MPPKGNADGTGRSAFSKPGSTRGPPWQEGFSFAARLYVAPLKLRRPDLPPIRSGRANPIDRIVDDYLLKHKLPDLKPIDDARFLRRASLDVVGLLPTLEQLDGFLANKDKDKRDRQLRNLLAGNGRTPSTG